MRLCFFGAGPMLEDDHLRYQLDGAMLARGLNPYTHSPEALLAGAGGILAGFPASAREIIATINFPDLRSIYPGAAQALFALANLMDPFGVDGLRGVILLSEALTGWLLLALLRAQKLPPVLAALYWCNPLLAFVLTGQAHMDAALMPAVLGALLAAYHQRGLLAGVLLGLGVGIKLWPVLLAPMLARALAPQRAACWRFCAVFALVSVALCLPLLLSARSAESGLVAYASGWSVNNAPYAWAAYGASHLFGADVGARLLRGALALGAGGLALGLAVKPFTGLPITGLPVLIRRAAVLVAFIFFASPAQFPWYAAWVLPFAVLLPSLALTSVAATIPVYFLFFPLAEAGLRDGHGYGLAALHSFTVLALFLMRKPRREPC